MTDKKTVKQAAAEKPVENMETAARFTAKQLINSQRFADRRDIVRALLEDGKTYTASEVTDKINNYMKGQVK